MVRYQAQSPVYEKWPAFRTQKTGHKQPGGSLWAATFVCHRLYIAKQDPHIILLGVNDSGNGYRVAIYINAVQGNLIFADQHTKIGFKSSFCPNTDTQFREMF